jgi:hypothetical protein
VSGNSGSEKKEKKKKNRESGELVSDVYVIPATPAFGSASDDVGPLAFALWSRTLLMSNF